MVWDRGVEPPSSDWKPDILAIIRIPQMPLNSDFILHLPRFTPAEDFGWSVYTTKQMCLVGGEGFEPSASGSQSNLKIAVQLFLQESIILRCSSN